jgi:hypothetical protein
MPMTFHCWTTKGRQVKVNSSVSTSMNGLFSEMLRVNMEGVLDRRFPPTDWHLANHADGSGILPQTTYIQNSQPERHYDVFASPRGYQYYAPRVRVE